ncbi:hypothetical protein C5167_003649 [Papaver somniferum]|uniref:Uncharacterized protein n=1 Tax=Papaver somniferum TaxID=3469 RepID=A0A4Y7L493_PAPSO|nr:hypothetical protein C5167_003649 [Papaver somniferum]
MTLAKMREGGAANALYWHNFTPSKPKTPPPSHGNGSLSEKSPNVILVSDKKFEELSQMTKHSPGEH